MGWESEFAILQETLTRWPPEQLVQEELERRDGSKIFTWTYDDILVARVHAREDNRIIKVLWPNISLN